MKKTLTLPESEIITLAKAAKEHGTVELAKMIGIGKTQLYRILSGHNRVTPETADKINAWLSTGIPQPEQPPKKRPFKSRNLATSQSRDLADRPAGPSINWNEPKFLRLAAVEVAAAILQGRLTNISITIGGHCKCGD